MCRCARDQRHDEYQHDLRLVTFLDAPQMVEGSVDLQCAYASRPTYCKYGCHDCAYIYITSVSIVAGCTRHQPLDALKTSLYTYECKYQQLQERSPGTCEYLNNVTNQAVDDATQDRIVAKARRHGQPQPIRKRKRTFIW